MEAREAQRRWVDLDGEASSSKRGRVLRNQTWNPSLFVPMAEGWLYPPPENRNACGYRIVMWLKRCTKTKGWAPPV